MKYQSSEDHQGIPHFECLVEGPLTAILSENVTGYDMIVLLINEGKHLLQNEAL